MKRKNNKAVATIYVILFVILLIAFVGYAWWDNFQKKNSINLLSPLNPTTIPKTTTKVPIPEVKITSTTYPNKNLTPGNILTMDEAFLCEPRTLIEMKREVPDYIKKQVFESYHIAYPPTKEYLLDKFIPLSLGGSDKVTNLWPQAASPPGYKEKDKVEAYLYKQMCDKKINITTAQEMIRSDWLKVYKEMK